MSWILEEWPSLERRETEKAEAKTNCLAVLVGEESVTRWVPPKFRDERIADVLG